jgi:hypothetical protein
MYGAKIGLGVFAYRLLRYSLVDDSNLQAAIHNMQAVYMHYVRYLLHVIIETQMSPHS